MAFAVGALQILPTVEYGRQAIRWVQAEQPVGWHDKVPYKVHEDYSIKPLSLLSIVIPGMDRTVNPHIGVVAFGLALVGAAAAWRDRRARWLAVIALGAFVFSLGPATLLHGILYATIPLVEKARAPAQALMLVHLGLCSLAAFGLDAARGTATRVAAYGLCATGILLAAVGFVLFKMGTLAIQGDSRFMVTALAALVAAVVLWMAPHRWSALVLFGLMLVETSGTSAQFTIYERQKERLAKLRQMAEDSDIIEYVRQQTSKPFRVEYDGEVFPHNLGNWWGIETFSTYNASAPDIVMRNDPYNPRVQAMLGVRYYLGTKPIRPDLVEVFRGVSGRTVYAYPNAFPRAWTVHEILQVKVSDTSKALADPSVDLTRKAIVTRAVPPLEQCAGDQVRVSRHEANRVEIEAELRCRGLVVLSETWFPGWRATVDGRPMEVYDADGMVRGVVVDGGRHAVVLTYRPWTVVVGAMLLLTATLFAAVVYWRQR